MGKFLIMFVLFLCFLILGCKNDASITQAQTVNVNKEAVQLAATQTPIAVNTNNSPSSNLRYQVNVSVLKQRESSLSHIEHPRIGEHYKPFWINDEDKSDNGFEPFCVQMKTAGKTVEKCGYQNDEGKILIEPRFARTYIFSEGLAGACPRIEQLCGYIDKKGQLVIKAVYQLVGNFSEGLGVVTIGAADASDYDKNGYIDKNGKFIIKPQYTDSEPFKNGIAKVKLRNINYCINKKNEEVKCPE